VTDPDSEFSLWFPLYFVALWLFVGLILSEVSRWLALARRFHAAERPAGTVLRGQVLGIGIVGENNVTGLIVTPAGLYMYANVLFRFRRPPLLIPWREVQYVSGRRFLWMQSHKLSLGAITSITIRDKALREFQPFLPTPVPINP
jgi:hypothetical protein